jgi:hypothetical protein
MAHWEYIVSAISGPLGLAAWRYAPRAFLMMVGGLTRDPQRSRQCAEMVRLSRKDAKDIRSYLTDSPDDKPPVGEDLIAHEQQLLEGSIDSVIS